jgi:hypothetical protein
MIYVRKPLYTVFVDLEKEFDNAEARDAPRKREFWEDIFEGRHCEQSSKEMWIGNRREYGAENYGLESPPFSSSPKCC